MRFEAWSAVWLLALLPALALLYAYGFRRRRQALAAFVAPDLAAGLLPAASAPARWGRPACLLGAVACCIVALMQPHWGQGARALPLLGRDVVVLLDVSYSMLAEDARPNRLERAKAAVRKLVEAVQREGGHRLGLLAFAGRADVLCPLTRDYEVFLKRLEDASPDAVVSPGTSIEGALHAAEGAFGALAPGYTDLILISDGGDHGGRPAEAAAELAQRHLSLYTVGVGDPDRSTPIPVAGGAGQDYLTRDGQQVRTRLESDVLVGVARAAGGTYRQLADGPDGLDRLYLEAIAGKPRRELPAAANPELAARYQLFLILAILLLVLDLVLESSGRRSASGRGPASDGWAASLAPLPRPRVLAGLLVLLPILGADQAERAVHQGNALYQAGQYQAALERYREAAGILPEEPAIQFDQGGALFKNRDQDQALDHYLRALTTDDPKLASRASYNIGVIKYRQALAAAHDAGDALPLTHAAVRYFRDSLALDPAQDDARYNLELAYRLQAQMDLQLRGEQENARQPQKTAFLKYGAALADQIRNEGGSQRQATPDPSHRRRNQDSDQMPAYFSTSRDNNGVPPRNAPLPAAMDAAAARQLMAQLQERLQAAEVRRQEQRRRQLQEAEEPMPW